MAKNETDSQNIVASDHCKNTNYLWKNYILNALENSLDFVYNKVKFAKGFVGVPR